MKPKRKGKPQQRRPRALDVTEAVERHKKQYGDITAAIEAMRQTQLTQAAKLRQLLTPVGYRFL